MEGLSIRRFVAGFAALFLAFPAAAQDTSDSRAEGRFSFVQDYEPTPAIWELSDEDTTIYMFGTIHSLPRNFRWRSDQLNEIIDAVDVLVVETSDYQQVPDPIDLDAKLTARMTTRLPTSSRLSTAANTRWRELINLSGLDYAAVDTMPVLLALLTMGMTGGEVTSSSSLYGVETVLEREFNRTNRPIESIEDAGEVMYSLLRLDNSELLRELDATLVDWDGKTMGAFFDEGFIVREGDAYWEAEHNWARGIVAEDFDMGFGDGEIGRAFDQNLLGRRNSAWADWIEERMEQPGSVLLAVGAGHFEGDSSLLVMLESRGISFERIDEAAR